MDYFREKIGELWEYRGHPVKQKLLAEFMAEFFDFMYKQYPIANSISRRNKNGDMLYNMLLYRVCRQGVHDDGFAWFLCSSQNWLFNSKPEYYYVLMDKKGHSYRVSYEKVYFYMQKLKLDFPAVLSIFWHIHEYLNNLNNKPAPLNGNRF